MKAPNMHFIGSITRFLVISTILLLPACASITNITQGVSTNTPVSVTATQIPSLILENLSVSQPSPTNISSPTQTTAFTETPIKTESDWRVAPIVPDVDQHVLQIYLDGQAKGRNPHNFSVIGDCQSIPYVFLGPFGRGELAPDSAESYLWDALNQFKDSFSRWSVTSRGGFTAASILNPLQADPHDCKPGETPLTCEYRLNNPAFVFITLETWLDPNTITRYETYLRQILDYVIGQGTVPILLTKADSAEVPSGKAIINPIIVRVAHEYDVPVVNFWRAAQYLSNGGIDPDREGFHLSKDGYKLKNILALRAIYTVWQAIQKGNTSAITGLSTPTPSLQPAPIAEPAPQIIVPDCTGGCVFFATATSQDGVVASQGVYAYAYAVKKLTSVLGEGFDLQDVSKDGQRLLVNKADNLYEINLATASSTLISKSFFHFGKQDAYWNSDDSAPVFIDQAHSFQTATGDAINLFPDAPDGERYFETGTCISKDYCQSTGIYRLHPDQSTTLLDSFSSPVFSPDGKYVAYLNPSVATKDNYYHIYYLLLEETDRGIASRRIFYFPEEDGFMVYPDVREFTFSPDGTKLFIIYDVYSAYFERSLRIKSYMLDLNTGMMIDYGRLDGAFGSLNPRLVWSPLGDKTLFFLTDKNSANQYSLGIFQTELNTDKRLVPYDQGVMTSSEFFYITNIFWL